MFGKKKTQAPQEPEPFPYGYSFKFKVTEFEEADVYSDSEAAKYDWWLWKNGAVVDHGKARVFLHHLDVEKQIREYGLSKAKEHKTKWAQRARFPFTLGETYVLE